MPTNFSLHVTVETSDATPVPIIFQRREISAREIPSRIASELTDAKLISLFSVGLEHLVALLRKQPTIDLKHVPGDSGCSFDAF